MALRARNASPSRRSTLNPQSTCHGPRPGPKLAYWVRAGSLCATEPIARGKTRGQKRKECRRVKKTRLYIRMYVDGMLNVETYARGGEKRLLTATFPAISDDVRMRKNAEENPVPILLAERNLTDW